MQPKPFLQHLQTKFFKPCSHIGAMGYLTITSNYGT